MVNAYEIMESINYVPISDSTIYTQGLEIVTVKRVEISTINFVVSWVLIVMSSAFSIVNVRILKKVSYDYCYKEAQNVHVEMEKDLSIYIVVVVLEVKTLETIWIQNVVTISVWGTIGLIVVCNQTNITTIKTI